MNVKKAAALFMAFSLVHFHWLSAAEDPSSAAETGPRKNVIGEATEAVVGRVFGVEGEASDIKYHAFELSGHSPSNAALRSTLVPGWGQGFNNQRVKGSVFFLATVGALIGSFHLYGKAQDSYDAYRAEGSKDGEKYDDYDRDRTRSMILGGAAAVLWVVGIFDAYRNAYHPLYSQENHIDVAFLGDETRVTVRKSF